MIKNKIIVIKPENNKYSPYQFTRGNCISGVHLATCMHCISHRKCKRRIQLRDILFDTLDRIENETDIRNMADICIYNIFDPKCEKKRNKL